MIKRSSQRLLSVLVATTMALSPLAGFTDIVRADGEVIKYIWAHMDQTDPNNPQPIMSTIGMTDSVDVCPDEQSWLIAEYIKGYSNYVLHNNYEYEIMILANNSNITADEDKEVMYCLAGDSSFTNSFMVATADESFPEYTGGDDNIGAMLEFFTSATYEEVKDDKGETISWPERYDFTFIKDCDIAEWFSADDVIVAEDVLVNVGVYDSNNDEWHDGQISANSILVNGEIHLGDMNKDGFESQLVIWDGGSLSAGPNGKITAACNAVLVFEKDATCSMDLPFGINVDGNLQEFMFEEDHDRYEFAARPVEENNPNTDIFWEYRQGMPSNSFLVHFDEWPGENGEARNHISVGEMQILDNNAYEYEIDKPITFVFDLSEEWNPADVIINVVQNNPDDADPTFTDGKLTKNNETSKWEFTYTPTNECGFEMEVFRSAFDAFRPQEGQFMVSVKGFNGGNATIGTEVVDEDLFVCDEGTKARFDYDFLEGDFVEVVITPDASATIEFIHVRIDGRDIEYRSDSLNPGDKYINELGLAVENGKYYLKVDYDFATQLIDESEEIGFENIEIEVGFFKEVRDGIEVDGRGAAVQYKLDNGNYDNMPNHSNTLEKDVYKDANSITFKFEYDDDRTANGVFFKYFEGDELKIETIEINNGEFTISKPEGGWKDYKIEVIDYNEVAFDGTYIVRTHALGSDEVSGVVTDTFLDIEIGQPISFKLPEYIPVNDCIVYVRYTNDIGGEISLTANDGDVFSFTPDSNEGFEIHIYADQTEYELDHLFADREAGQRDFEIRIETSGFDDPEHPENSHFFNSFGRIEVLDNPIIDRAIVSGNRARVVVDQPKENEASNIQIKVDPKYDSVCYVRVDGIDVMLDEHNIATINIENILNDNPQNIEVIFKYDEPVYMEVESTSQYVTAKYSFDGEGYSDLNYDNIVDLKGSEADKIYLKVICDEGFAASKVELLDAGYQHISDVAIGEDGVCVIENGDGWQQFYARIIVDELAGYFTCELAREDDAGKLTLAYDFDTEIEYYKDQDISIKTVSGTVYTAVASSATVSNIILQRDGDVFRFRPNSESYEDYVITFYTSEEEYLFETLQGDKVAMCYPVDMTGESGSLEFTEIDHSHSYQGCTKWSYTGDDAEIVIRPNQDYDYTVMVGETDVTASAKSNDNKYVIEGTGWPTITFFALSVLESDTTDTAFEGDLGTSYAMTAKIKNTGVQVASYTWFKSEDNGANYVQLETTTATLNDTPTTSSIYKCVVADTNGRSIDIFFNVNVIFRIVDNTSNDAKSISITKTESATLAVNIDEIKTTGLTYKWQNSNDSEHWNDMTETTKSITVTPNATTSYKCTVTDEHNNAPVEIMFTVTVIVPELTDARTDSQKVLKVLYGSGSTFRVVTSLDGKNADLQYTWSRSTDGESYNDMTAVDTPILGFAINNDFPYFYYKCIVTDKYGNVLPLVFTIDPEYSFTAEAKDDIHEFTVFKSESAELAVEINDVNTDEVAISWCVSADGTTPGDAVPNSDDKTSITVSPDATTYYICHIEDPHDNSCDIYFTVNVVDPVITDNTDESAKLVKLELGDSATLTADIDESTTKDVTYTWYESDNAESFTKTIDGTTNEVTVTPRTTTYYCCKVADGFDNEKSIVFKVEVSYDLTDTTTETTKTITKFESATITASVDSSKALGPITYSWSCSTDGTNYEPMETQTKATITVSPLVTTYYKCLVADGDRNSVEIKFTVKVSVPELKDTTSASAKSVTATKDDTITLTASVNETETTGIAYKWTQSTDGKTFTPVSNGTGKTLNVKVTENITYVCTVTDKYENEVQIKFTVTAKDKVTPPPSSPSPSPAPEEQQFEGFVERLYNVALGRDSEQGGKDYWCDLVGNGQLTGADAARSFLKSPEFHDKNLSDEEFLKVLYKTFFDREPDPEGLQYWLGVLKTTSQDAVVEGFINSTEWCNVCASYGVKSGATNAKATIASANAVEFAKRLYTECLGREAEQGGLDYWSLALTNLEVTGSGAARLFFESDEFIGFKTDDKEYLTRLYKTFMGRDPDDAGMNYWLGVLKAQSREAVFNSFVASQEFTDICNSYGINR